MFKKKIAKEAPEVTQTIELKKNDVAIVLRANGSSETFCKFNDKNTLTPQDEVILAIGGLLQHGKWVDTFREYFMVNMQNMLSSNMIDDMSSED